MAPHGDSHSGNSTTGPDMNRGPLKNSMIPYSPLTVEEQVRDRQRAKERQLQAKKKRKAERPAWRR